MFWPRLGLALLAGLASLWVFGPRDRLEPVPATARLPVDPQAWLAIREKDIRPEVSSYLQWADRPGRMADLAILYVHGFSASPGELRPLPEDLARQLGANLLAIRFTGHGQGGAELAAARAGEWWRDLEDGLTVAGRMGRRVLVLGTSTGATLAALAARDPKTGRAIDAVILISPNFALRGQRGWTLDIPFARAILGLAGNPERCFVTRNGLHAARWTSCYPVQAVLPMGAILRQARQRDYRGAKAPALFVWSDADRIIDHRRSAQIAEEWGGGATVFKVTPGPQDDPDAHVIAGEALSPAMTADLTLRIADWVRATVP